MAMRDWPQARIALLWFIWLSLLGLGMALPMPSYVSSNLLFVVAASCLVLCIVLAAPIALTMITISWYRQRNRTQ
jgi:hypothetical protein